MPRVYTEETKKLIRQRERALLHYYKNKEKINQQRKEYYKKNKKEICERQKKYIQENNEKVKINSNKYRQSPNGKKAIAIDRWKRKGLVSTDYNLLYDNYLKSKNCEECGIEYGNKGDGTGTFKCMDHNHETGLFRNFICCGCNRKRG